MNALRSIATVVHDGINRTFLSARFGDTESISWVIIGILGCILIVAGVLQVFIPGHKGVSRSKNAASLPPSYRCGIPVIGNIVQFARDPLGLIWDAYQSLGPCFTVRLAHKRLTFLIGPEAHASFFRGSDEELSQREPYSFSVPVFGKGVLYDAPLHIRLQQLRTVSVRLRIDMLKTYVPMMISEAKLFFERWGDSGEVDLLKELGGLIIMTASRCLMGREVRENMFEEVSTLIHSLDQGMQPISVLAPQLPTKEHRKRDEARREMSKLFKPIIGKRRKERSREDDMLQWLIDAKYRDGSKFSDEDIVGLLIAAIFGGQHTSVITSTWIGMHLLRSPSMLKRVKEEQKKVLDENEGHLGYDALVKMDELHRVMKETLRLHPPLIFLIRQVMEPRFALGGKYQIPQNDYLVVSPDIAGKLPTVYKNPKLWDPDRFTTPRDEDKKAPFSFLGFGAGRHGCMGEGFATLQVKTIWSVMLSMFEMEAVGDKVPDPDYKALVVGPKLNTCFLRYRRKKTV
eukprot:Plantae.Rhodophyta-Hildenbrandia_rubra.ctg6083.p1 GENE.Plantae.Rhodophyta-Hildenbrandia_rubra.ctg6083~~Plantae.Rhodophyta-Hildenbrandia_rubra.ctg6083.p1  ORF type:complete len:515 (+),score=65.98 Plantae.Rhodophyta-Hildenbrandia_rubra.ctg6083:804-2348(+)